MSKLRATGLSPGDNSMWKGSGCVAPSTPVVKRPVKLKRAVTRETSLLSKTLTAILSNRTCWQKSERF